MRQDRIWQWQVRQEKTVEASAEGAPVSDWVINDE